MKNSFATIFPWFPEMLVVQNRAVCLLSFLFTYVKDDLEEIRI